MSQGTPGTLAVHSRAAALVLLVLLSLVWGFHWVVVKIGLDYLPPLTYATLRVGLGLVTVVVILRWQRRLRRPARADLPIVLSVGLVQVAALMVITTLALQVVPAGRSAVLVYTMPIWVAVLLALAFRVRPRPNEVAGLVLGIVGLVLLLNPSSLDWNAAGELPGTLALLFGAVLWAAVTIHIRRHRWGAAPFELQPWQLLVALAPLALVSLPAESGQAIRWEPTTIAVLLFSGILATAFAYWALQSITRALGAQASATGFLATPVVGLVSGALVLGEAIGPLDVLGFALLLAGIAVTSLLTSTGTAGETTSGEVVAGTPATERRTG